MAAEQDWCHKTTTWSTCTMELFLRTRAAWSTPPEPSNSKLARHNQWWSSLGLAQWCRASSLAFVS